MLQIKLSDNLKDPISTDQWFQQLWRDMNFLHPRLPKEETEHIAITRMYEKIIKDTELQMADDLTLLNLLSNLQDLDITYEFIVNTAKDQMKDGETFLVVTQ